ncbi:glutathione S-transferase family protein [Sphingopyxis alaskensis]|uniref:Glutathione S-transferase-like protein n=1 Tax=Sphingopyxis alaskensis (strain DSM 13593 / LMG 18877 / RB2256) TaxID=317655 RepID=Q1GPD9_SPHAL|nr:glutathione S-transferase family protein [Sphingopyxis alaskensis]ABF54483.1 glutathione S-transferase-like protein [Sphingopyxis alaskensis RB2256]MCM3417794.1 glutathione S-transferase family protein [Sphingopyxis alaskensis]
MADELIFYTNPMSRGQIVRWMLEEVGAPYEPRILDYGTTMKEAAYLAVNPMGKVPAIVHNGKVVTECAAICAYLADAFPDKGLAPALTGRADYYRWLFFTAGPVEQAITAKMFGFEPDAEQQRMAGFGSLAAALDALESAVSGKSFIAGDHFSAADVYVGSQIDWGLQFGTIASRPAFEAYIAPLRERVAYKRAKDIDNALIAEMQAANPA